MVQRRAGGPRKGNPTCARQNAFSFWGSATMDASYRIEDTSRIISPGLIVFRELMEANLDAMIRIAGTAGRLRPHCKTHKMPQVTKIELARGIRKHKCATFAEAEMLADAGVSDIFLSYNLVGP